MIADHYLDTEIPYEDYSVLSFLDHRPHSKGHSMIISKEHFKNTYEIDQETPSEAFRVAKLVAGKIDEMYSPLELN